MKDLKQILFIVVIFLLFIKAYNIILNNGYKNAYSMKVGDCKSIVEITASRLSSDFNVSCTTKSAIFCRVCRINDKYEYNPK